MEGIDSKNDNQILNFKFNEPKMLSSLSFNSVDQQHSPLGYDKIESQPASGNYDRTKCVNVSLGPAPRSQLGVPTRKYYFGSDKKYYKPILDNGNWVRGNQFGVDYPYVKNGKFLEVVSMPSVIPEKKGPVDYLGNDAKVIIRNNDPFYPYPSQKLLRDKNYWSYMHPHNYVNGQPIYNYPYGKMEGDSRGPYKGGMGFDPYNPNEAFCGGYDVVEGFSGGCGCGRGMGGLMFGFVMVFLVVLIIYFLSVRRR